MITNKTPSKPGSKTFCKANDIPLAGLEWKPLPFSGEWGISTSFFSTAAAEARLGKKIVVATRAQEIAAQVKSPGRVTFRASAGLKRSWVISTCISTRRNIPAVWSILSWNKRDRFGSGPATGQRVMIEFSHPNTHKAFHVGHLRGTILGDALCRILEFAGNDVVRANYPGDMGMHVIKWLWGYLKFHNGEEPATDITRWMGEVYAEAAHRIEQDPNLEAELRALYARWDQRDPEIVALVGADP